MTIVISGWLFLVARRSLLAAQFLTQEAHRGEKRKRRGY
jgi:hypothetical protein